MLDSVDPRILANQPLTSITEEKLSERLIKLLSKDNGQGIAHRTATILLRFIQRGLNEYCRHHKIRIPRLPVGQELELENGLLSGESLGDLNDYRTLVEAWSNATLQLLGSPNEPTAEAICGLIVMSAALFGGIARKDQLDAIVRSLRTPLPTDGEIIWLNLPGVSRQRFIADPASEALLRRFATRNELPLQGPSISLPDSVSPKMLAQALRIKGVTVDRLLDAARAGQLRHFAPDVISIANGAFSNTCCADESWIRFIAGTRRIAPIASASIYTTAHRKHVLRIAETKRLEIITRILAVADWNETTLRAEGKTDLKGTPEDQYRRRLASCLAAETEILKDEAKRSGVPDSISGDFAYSLVKYGEDLLEIGGMAKKVLAPSTINTYISIAAKSLSRLNERDLRVVDACDRELIYDEAIDRAAASQINVVRTVLEGFERTLQRHLEVEDEVDWGLLAGASERQQPPQADANLVDPASFDAMIESIERSCQIDPKFKRRALFMAILLYRFGTRTGEATEIKTGDVEFLGQDSIVVHVRTSELTRRKTGQAIRRIGPIKLPLREYSALQELVEEQARIFRDHKQRNGTYVFADEGSPDKLGGVETIASFVRDVVRVVSGDPSLRLRHFRHSFITREFLAGRNGGSLEETGACAHTWQRVWRSGHASPATGVESYINAAELAHYHYTTKCASHEIPLVVLSCLAGLEAKSLNRAVSRNEGKDKRSGEAKQPTIRLYLNALRRSFPCSLLAFQDQRNGRFAIEPVELTAATPDRLLDESESTTLASIKIAWPACWELYAEARAGRPLGMIANAYGLSMDTARRFEDGVRVLINTGVLVPRIRRKPMLTDKDNAAGEFMLGKISKDTIRSVLQGMRYNQGLLRLKVEVAENFAVLADHAGLDGLQISPAGLPKFRKVARTKGGQERSWLELVACLAISKLEPHDLATWCEQAR